MLDARRILMAAAPAAVLILAACARGGPAATAPPASENAAAGTISRLVVGAASGATVLVPAGTYHEQVEITKPLTLRPLGDGPVVIDGECERENGISIPTGSGITVSGIEVRNTVGAGVFIGNGSEEQARPEHVTIDGLTISDFDCREGKHQYNAGVAAFHSACCITVTNNTITYRSGDAVRGLGDGIWFKSNSQMPSGGGHYIAGNTISGGWDGIGGENEDDPRGSFDRDTVIENNVVRGCWDDGIQVEGGNENITVRGNDISGCGTGIAMAPTLTGPLYVERNVIRDLEEGAYENRFCFKVGLPGAGVAYLTENVCESEGGGIVQTNSGIFPLVARDNCIAVSGYVLVLGEGLPEGSEMDGDYLWTSSDEHFIAWDGEKYASLSEFRRETGWERAGRQSRDCPVG